MSDYTTADDFKDDLCEDFTGRVDTMTLHTDAPGTTGTNDSGVTPESLTWSEPEDGVSSATAVFENLAGDYPWIGLWDGATFRMGLRVNISNAAARDVAIMVTHEVA